jgi:ComF family protein
MIEALANLFFPKVCVACGESMTGKLEHLCLACRHKLPRMPQFDQTENLASKVFWSRVPFQRVSAYLLFQKKGSVQAILHQLKYKGKKEIGLTMGGLMAQELMQTNFFEGIDYLVPVPIHPMKQKKRGYNQSLFLAKGVEAVAGIELRPEVIKKELNTASQTRKGRFKRWENVSASFALQETKPFENKHLLLIDDVLTTGSTAEACAQELLKIEGLKVSFLSLAISQ